MIELLDLPQKNKETGRSYISYSQYSSYKAIKSFNLSTSGKNEYMLNYFLKKAWADEGWSQFGKEVEAYIMSRECSDKFTVKERGYLDKIKPIGKSIKFTYNMGGFDVYGIIDDAADDHSYYRDFKTGAIKRLKQYDNEDYLQLQIYALNAVKITGNIPYMEMLGIERKGDCRFGKGRKVLTVGRSVVSIEKHTTMEKLEELKHDIILTANEISEHYKMFKRINV